MFHNLQISQNQNMMVPKQIMKLVYFALYQSNFQYYGLLV